jgi:hypothetical protein
LIHGGAAAATSSIQAERGGIICMSQQVLQGLVSVCH